MRLFVVAAAVILLSVPLLGCPGVQGEIMNRCAEYPCASGSRA